MIERADIEESKSSVATVARPLQASYPCGNFSVTRALHRTGHGISRPGFPPSRASTSTTSSRLVPLCSRRGFLPRGSHLRTSVFTYNSRAAPAKLPICITHSPRPGRARTQGPWKRTAGAWQWPRTTRHSRSPTSLRHTRLPFTHTKVKLNRVFFPR